MKPAKSPRSATEKFKLLVVADGVILHSLLDRLPDHLEPGDLLVVNDAATLPASLHGSDVHGNAMELRLTRQLHGSVWQAVAFGEGSWKLPTEDRPSPPRLKVKDGIVFASGFSATILELSQLSDRLMTLDFNVQDAALWHSLYQYGRPVQYSYMHDDLGLWSVQNSYSSRPWAAEMPSAGHGLDWGTLLKLFKRGVHVVALTHGAGLSSTGDGSIDAALPLKERYEIPSSTMEAVLRTRKNGKRVVAVGTSVVRALESADQGLSGTTSLHIGPGYQLKSVDGLLTGTHEVSESHFQLLRAFLSEELLMSVNQQLETNNYLTHEFGDLCLVFDSND